MCFMKGLLTHSIPLNCNTRDSLIFGIFRRTAYNNPQAEHALLMRRQNTLFII